MSAAALDWSRDGGDWPNRAASRFVDAGGVRWHVQVAGAGPVLLLLHGTGAATHSWRDVMPLLATRFTVVAPDLPGHGFTSLATGDGMSLPGMSRRLGDLLDALGLAPSHAIGHSAGAAVAARMVLDGRMAPAGLVSINGAFVPFAGVLRAFSPVAKFLATTSLAARIAARRAQAAAAVPRLLASTGSRIDARGVALYARLMQSPTHVAGALAMMASWDLDPLPAKLRDLRLPVLLVAGGNDRTVPPAQADTVAAWLPDGRVERLAGLGHLAHEEAPGRVVDLALAFVSSLRVDPGSKAIVNRS